MANLDPRMKILDSLLTEFRFCRYKGESYDHDDQVALAIRSTLAKCTGLFEDREGCSISTKNGALTLTTVVVSDEGPYVCKKSFKSDGSSDVGSSDSWQYRIIQLNVNGKMYIILCLYDGGVISVRVSLSQC